MILCLSLFISILPMYANAESNSDENTSEQSEINNDLTEKNTEGLKELESERSEYSKTFTDNNGNLTTEVYAEPIHTKINGEWEEISTDLSLDKKNEVYETERTQLEAAYPLEISSKEQIDYTYGQHTLKFTNITASDGDKDYTLEQSQNTQNNDNKVLYKDVLPGIDLRHVSLNNEVKEDWIINEYNDINEFNYVVNTDLTPQLEDDGSIGFFENKENQVFTLPSPLMEDSNINNGLGSGVKSKQLHYELNTLGDNQYSIKLVVDKEWLESKDRVYPVYIDPSVSVDAMGDSFVSSASPSTNFNKEWDSVQGEYVLKVGKYDSSTGTNYAFIKFSLTNLKGAVIDSADLQTYVTHAYYVSQKTGLWVDRLTGPWYANELNWNNKPGSTPITSTTVARDQWASFNVKDTVQGWIDGDYQNDGFKLHTNGNGQTYWKKLSSAETANVAKLVISYHYPTMKNPTVKASQTADGATTGYVDVSWPSMYGAKSYELQMYNGKSFETVYTGTGTSWSSKNKKMFPKSPYSTSSSYKLDSTGVELPVDPSAFYSTKSGTSTTRKEYGFKVKAMYENGSSAVSSEIKKAIPANLVDIPDIPTVKAYSYAENDSVNKGRGWLDISWDPVPGATGYKVLILNGVKYEEYSVGNVTKWSTKGQKIWPTDAEIAAGKYTLHKDKLGSELAINPNSVYVNSGDYFNFKRYSIRIKAESSLGVTDQSDSQYGYIPLPTVKNISVSNEIIDDVNNRGILNIKWDKVTDAGGYIVEINDGSGFKSYDVGNVTSWSTLKDKNGEKFSLFPNIDYLPIDPAPYYKANGSDNKKGYEVRVRAYTINDDTEPPSEKEKIDGPRGLSEPSTSVENSFSSNEELSGIEDYFTYGTHQMGNAITSVNVTTGNVNFSSTDHSLNTKGILDFDFNRYYNSKSSQVSALGKGWTFDGNEYLLKKSANSSDFYYWDGDGTRHEFVYSSNGTYKSPNGKYLELKDVIVNNKAGFSLTDRNGLVKYFEADPTLANKYRLYSYEDANNNKIIFKYLDNKLAEISEVDENNNNIRDSIKLTYNKYNLLVKTSYKDRWIEYAYDNNQRLINTTIKASNTTKSISNNYDYNESGLLSEYTDARNNVNSISYDNNIISVLTPQADGKESVLTTYSFDKKTNNYIVSDTEGNKTIYNRDTTNNTYAVIKVTNSDGTYTASKYDVNYNELISEDELGKTETSKYDANGNMISFTDSNGNTTVFTYDGKNQIIEQTDQDGVKTINQYEGYHLISSKEGNEITKYGYDSFGRITKITYPNNSIMTTSDDEDKNSITVTDSQGNKVITIYNGYGEVISETDGENKTISYTLDPLYPKEKTSVKDGNGNTTYYKYDANGNMISIINAAGKEKTFKYNGNDQLTEYVLPVSSSMSITEKNDYDENGNLKKTQGNSGITKNYTYNNTNQLTGVTIGNANGENILGWTNTYNNSGELQSVTYKNLLTNTTLIQKNYTYTTSNLIESFLQGKFTAKYEYDDMDQLNHQIFTFDDSSNMLKINKLITYNDEGITNGIAINTGNSSLFKVNYNFDSTKRQTLLDYNDGLVTKEYNYDNSNKLTSINYALKNNTQIGLQYTYDKSGNIVKESNGQNTNQYIYDNNNQLIKEDLSDGLTTEYKYNNLGDRVSVVKDGKITSYNFNDANQIIKKDNTDYTYDKDGNLLTDEKYKYSYDELGNLISITTLKNTLVAKYDYDETGLRIRKTLGTKTIEYYYTGDENNLSLEVTKENGQVKSYHYYEWDSTGKALGMIIRTKDSSGAWQDSSYYFITNQRGDVTQIIDNNGILAGNYTYDSFGNILSQVGTIATENSIRYASYYFDQETSLYYLKARYYKPIDGIFLSLDDSPGSIDNPISQNGYIYANNNPVTYLDTDGNFAQAAALVGSYFIPGLGEATLLASGVVVLAGVSWKAGSWVAGLVANYAKKTEIPKKMRHGEKVSTPDTHPEEWTKVKKKSNVYTNKKTKWKAQLDTGHRGRHWDMSPKDGKSGDYHNVSPDGRIL